MTTARIRQLLGIGGRGWTITLTIFTISFVALCFAPLRPGDQPGRVEIAAMWLLPVSGLLAFWFARNWRIRLGFVAYVGLAVWLTGLVGEKWFQCGPPHWFERPVCERVFNLTVNLTVTLMLGLLLWAARSVLGAIDRRRGSAEPR